MIFSLDVIIKTISVSQKKTKVHVFLTQAYG